MSSSEVRVEHVSDTALIVAAARARETARPDGVLRDPFAERLAGSRGMDLLRKLGAHDWLGVAVVGLRARSIDEMLLEAIAERGIRTVVLLGAGLDARAWRLDLRRDLRWIEVDFAPILEYKEKILASEKPRCRRERISADLTVASERQAVWAAAGSEPGLIITEGLLLYLPAHVTEALATEPPRQSGIRHWLLDIAPSALMRHAHQEHMEEIEKVRAPDRVEGRQILELAERHGCRQLKWHNYTREGFALAASRGMSISQEAIQEAAANDPSGIYLYRMP
ncbi:MAG TPA: SAM-dependent methyltransferase [Bryobacteraceae bacterium]|nr:SAM-dependent methyltransferase [Bryobacteraceae bacterium]